MVKQIIEKLGPIVVAKIVALEPSE